MSVAVSSFSHCRSSRFSRVSSASLYAGLPQATTSKIASVSLSVETTERIAKLFDKNEISISTYDTAWVAMAASPFSPMEPCFPDSLQWLLENQCPDGSWARPHHHSFLKKDVLSSTLASVLALKKWGVGQQHIDKGLHFVESNFGWATDEKQITPMGFEIIFPGMIDEARALSLNPSLEQTTLNHVMNLRDLELQRIYSSTDKEAYMAYIGEGLMLESTAMMKYQRKNGSLFNSPSSTAAAFTACADSGCLSYLNLVVNKFGGAVPAVYPLDVYYKLRTVDNLESLGISRYFITEIRSMLNQIYRCWMQGDEELFMDASTCALAFKILRKNGYSVTSDDITKVIQEQFPSSMRGHMTNINTTLELFRASELMLYPHESELEKHNSNLRSILEHELSSASIESPRLNAKVKHALDFPFYAILERMATRKNIEHFDCFDNTRMLKTSYCLPNLGSKDLFLRAVEDFNMCQAIHREEFIEFKRWFVEHRLDEVDLAMNKFIYCYFTAAATFSSPELSDARLSWAKNAAVVSIADDLYDVKGSYEEKRQLIELLQIWDVDMSKVCCSKDVEIIFLALKSIVVELEEKGSKLQGRSLTTQGITVWVECLNAYMQEVEWEKMGYVPTFDEYLENAYVSFGLGPILEIPIYLVGPKISQEMVNHPEYLRLFKSMSICGRLTNDIRGHDRESQEGKVSGVALYIAQKGGMSREAAVSEILRYSDAERRELLGLVCDDGSVFPKAIKELYWHMNTVTQLFYKKDDGFWSKELTLVAQHIIQDPILLVPDYARFNKETS